MLISEVMNKLQNLAQNQTETLWFVGVHSDGSLNIRFDNGTLGNLDDHTTITTKHSYTPENGYTFRDGNIFKPDGTELFAPD